jgi:UDP-N-acetylmuramate--alanine ligase
MVGIGGVSMSGLSRLLLIGGFEVSGSDAKLSNLTKNLEKIGVKIFGAHSPENINGADLVCYSSAVKTDNPELIEAKKRGVPIIERSELLGKIIKGYKFPIAVSGTHGKTTTTAMLSSVMMEASFDPTILIGADFPQIGGNIRLGSREFLVFEACEYAGSFLNFRPHASIITNVDDDHLDYYGNLSGVISAFSEFAKLTNPRGAIVACANDKNTRTALADVTDKKIIWYGLENENCEFSAKNIEQIPGGSAFDIFRFGEKFLSLTLQAPGRHNILNALAAAATANFYNVRPEFIARGLENFSAPERRFQRVGEINGAPIIDDYAHHPSEIRATLDAAKSQAQGFVWCVFQPHTFSRTRALLNGFTESLSLADRAIIAEIYAARETNPGDISGKTLAGKIPGALFMNDFAEIANFLKKNVSAGDIVITMGAGDITNLGNIICGNSQS